MASASAPAVTTPFDRLAQVEVQLVMHCCDQATLLSLARCNRRTLAAASNPFAWRSLSPLELQFEAPLKPPSRVSQSPLRHADLSVGWNLRAQRDIFFSETKEQWSARAEVEAAALVAMPGLRRLEVRGRSTDMARICSALLARLDSGGAVTSLSMHLFHGQLRHAECRPLGELVARSRTLTALSAEGYFGSDAIRQLAKGVRHSQSLTSLNLSRNHLGSAKSALAAAVAHCRTLTDLQLARCAMNDGGVETLVAALCQEGSGIRALNLSGNSFGRVGAAAVARLLASDSCAVQSLNLSHCFIGFAGAESLAKSLQTNRTLTELRLAGCRIKSDGTASLIAALQGNSHLALRLLDLAHDRIDAKGATALAQYLRSNTALEQLDLSTFWMDDAAVVALAVGLPAAHSLRELRLVLSTFGVAGATALAAGIQACPSLTLLDVSHNAALGDGGMAALTPALTHFRTFDASQCGLTSGAAAALASLLQPGSQLEALRLNNNAIGSADVVALSAPLDSSSPLRILHLMSCDLDAQGAAALAEALRRGWSVTDLRLVSNQQIGDDGSRALAAALEQCARVCSLHTLHMSSCGLSLAGVLALARVAVLAPSLRVLNLFSNPAMNSPSLPADQKAALLAARGPGPHLELWL